MTTEAPAVNETTSARQDMRLRGQRVEDAPKPAEATEPAHAAAPKKSNRKTVLGLLAAAAIAAAGGYWFLHHGIETTDDAQIDGDVVSVPARTAAVVTSVNFVENQTVKAGEILATLDDAPAKAHLAQADAAVLAAQANADAADADARVAATSAKGNKSVATASLAGARVGAGATRQQIEEGEAQLKAAQAALDQASIDKERAEKLFDTQAISKAELDRIETRFTTDTANVALARARLAELRATQAEAASRVSEASARAEVASDVDVVIKQAEARAAAAHAQVKTAEAMRDLAALELSYTKIVAPQDGVVSKKAISVGQMVQPGSPIVALVPTDHVWVTGNFKETQLEHMKVGQPAKIEVDAYPGADIEGEVESFSAATGAKFALIPADNASGNYTKVVQRVPVRVKITKQPQGIDLRPGMSVDLSVNTRNH